MYTDPTQWSRIRNRVLVKGESRRSVSRSEHIHRHTLARMLANELPNTYRRDCVPRSAVLGDYLDDLRELVEHPPADCKTGRDLWRALVERGCQASYKLVLYYVRRLQRERAERMDVWARLDTLSDREAANMLRQLVRLPGHTNLDPGLVERKLNALVGRPPSTSIDIKWSNWLSEVERKKRIPHDMPAAQQELLHAFVTESKRTRHRALCVLASQAGFSVRTIAARVGASKNTVNHYVRLYQQGGFQLLNARKPRQRLADGTALRDAIFRLLHEPPSLSSFNRTTWRLADIREALRAKGFSVGEETIRIVLRADGFRWKSAKVVLTSHDPQYREKLAHIQGILSNLQPGERFFSIDEFGPFAVKMKGGRCLTPQDVEPMVPQWQKSKGCLVMTAALELSANQVTHFYSKAKNTQEMIRLANVLLAQYASVEKLYLSWDAASWHLSKTLVKFVASHNETASARKLPLLELAPLPASAQFLNVIESVFSGMARAIIHCSDYDSKEAAEAAIDRYFEERNRHFLQYPKRAGNKIWGAERVPAVFSESNNCKDPAYR
jgi:transposase